MDEKKNEIKIIISYLRCNLIEMDEYHNIVALMIAISSSSAHTLRSR